MNKGTPTHVENRVFDRDWRDEKFTDKTTQEVAQDRAILEADLTPWQAIRAYPMAIFWSLMVSMCVIMEGYDTILIGNFFAYPTFQRKYGNYVGVTSQTPSGYQVSAQMASRRRSGFWCRCLPRRFSQRLSCGLVRARSAFYYARSHC